MPSILDGYYPNSDVNGRDSSLENQEMQGTMGMVIFPHSRSSQCRKAARAPTDTPSSVSRVFCSPPPSPDTQPRGEEYTEVLSLSLFSNVCSRERLLTAGSRVSASQTGPQRPPGPAVRAQVPRLACLVKNELRQGGTRQTVKLKDYLKKSTCGKVPG